MRQTMPKWTLFVPFSLRLTRVKHESLRRKSQIAASPKYQTFLLGPMIIIIPFFSIFKR